MMTRYRRIDVLLRIAVISGLSMMVLIVTTLAKAHDISTANGTLTEKQLTLSSLLTLSWSPDGKKIAVGGKQGGQIYTVDFNNAIELEGDDQRLLSIIWSPDGRTLAGAVDDKIWLWDGNTGKKLALLSGPSSTIASVAWKPDGSAIAAGATFPSSSNVGSEIYIWRTDNFQLLKILKDQEFDQIITVSWSPSGEYIVDNSAPLGVRIWNVNNSQILFHLRKGSEVSCAAWSP